MKEQTPEEMQQETAAFLAMAFCIDGECKCIGEERIVGEEDDNIRRGLTYELNDSKRGKFHITMSTPKDHPINQNINHEG